METPEVPERVVLHDFDDDAYIDLGQVGQAQSLPMSSQQKAAARRRRQRLDEQLGGFGFRQT